MKIRLLAFASAAEALGWTEAQIELPDGSRLEDLKARLGRDHPALDPLWPRLAVAVEGELAGPGAELADGAEVALLPPVSGGSPAGRTALVDGSLDIPQLLRATAHPSCGALVLFVGTVREARGGLRVVKITYQAYRAMAAGRLEAMAGELESSYPGVRIRIVHRLGEVPLGEPSVAIAAASPHRVAAYEASRTALERLKREVPIWKREHYADGSAAWREEEDLAPLLAAPHHP